ncbi:uncharacterized protein CELE_B0286.1 [Caenorhabditis elegans]|uniref:Uncharacterized protein B0286.1 n=1 Tax=Caenorhabditis elegans TaxID=6239 RepID=YWQ1_CAEEL|nr:Uncharacterized protein CELE_B0286.1 [Caenorhabditis elegans]Q10921.2 RecName: Full=Uncharacterized protein B0286.1 [Caenorhabditis elegans]CCD61660.1 Uncharacterized protein CELE_B0286.1 [Caenorhabditis elegans]|eukprot:NP_494776.2 Uncharacterized protein CELE_B0286.1 [Caenorhabditis elegans]
MLQKEHASALEKLRVIWLHKKKIEAELQSRHAESTKFLSKIKLKESEIYGLKTKQETCQKELTDCQTLKEEPKEQKKENNKNDENSKKTIEKYEQEIAGLKEKIEGLEEKVKNNYSDENSSLKEELKQCETRIRQLTGGGAIEHYSQNETAHFSRNQKADEPLFFDRGNIQHHIPQKLLLGRELVQTLEEAKVKKLEEREQMDKHPQDRDNKDKEVNEQPDNEEQDYKEH